MRLAIKLVVVCLFVGCLAGSWLPEPARAGKAVKRNHNGLPLRARAIVQGPNGIQGEVLFLQGLAPAAQRRLLERPQNNSETFLSRVC